MDRDEAEMNRQDAEDAKKRERHSWRGTRAHLFVVLP
jgi:hypothetical protein